MATRPKKPVSYTNRQGRTYYLHAATRKSGKTVYVMKTTAAGALTELPEGYAITENVNGQIGVGRKKPRIITEEEEALVVKKLNDLGFENYRCEAKSGYLTIWEPSPSLAKVPELVVNFPGLSPHHLSVFLKKHIEAAPMEAILRFRLTDKKRRLFNLERMTWRGDGGWKSLWQEAPLDQLAAKYLPHIGKDSFYELI